MTVPKYFKGVNRFLKLGGQVVMRCLLFWTKSGGTIAPCAPPHHWRPCIIMSDNILLFYFLIFFIVLWKFKSVIDRCPFLDVPLIVNCILSQTKKNFTMMKAFNTPHLLPNPIIANARMNSQCTAQCCIFQCLSGHMLMGI